MFVYMFRPAVLLSLKVLLSLSPIVAFSPTVLLSLSYVQPFYCHFRSYSPIVTFKSYCHIQSYSSIATLSPSVLLSLTFIQFCNHFQSYSPIVSKLRELEQKAAQQEKLIEALHRERNRQQAASRQMLDAAEKISLVNIGHSVRPPSVSGT